jgi:hypothetical protein
VGFLKYTSAFILETYFSVGKLVDIVVLLLIGNAFDTLLVKNSPVHCKTGFMVRTDSELSLAHKLVNACRPDVELNRLSFAEMRVQRMVNVNSEGSSGTDFFAFNDSNLVW